MGYLLFILLTVILINLLRLRWSYFKLVGLNFTAFDGLFFGGIFYMFIPLCYYIIMQRELDDVWVDIPVFFEPLDGDIITLIYIFLSLFIFGIFSIISQKGEKRTTTCKQLVNEKYLFFTIFILYIVSQITFLLKSGKLEGGAHWYESNAAVFESGVIYSLIGQFNNVGRLLLPAMGMYFELRYKSKRYFHLHIILSCILVVVELFLTGNRIALLYIAVSHLIPFIFQRKYKYIIFCIFLTFPIFTIASFWPIVRGLMWTDKITLEHIEYVYENAKQAKAIESHDPVIIFTEGMNLFVLNYIVNSYPKDYDYTYGETMLLKSTGTLIPKKIWANKPDGVGRDIGRQLIPASSHIVLNPSLIGETWVNFGFLGNILLVLIIRLFSILDIGYVSNQLYRYMLFFIAIAAWRFDSSFFFIAFYTILIYSLISKLPFIQFCLRKLRMKLMP